MRTAEETERALKLAERLMKVAPNSSLASVAKRMKKRMTAMPMRQIIAKMPGTTIIGKARTLGVTRQTVYYWLDGATRPNEDQARKLSKLTGISVDVIRGLDGDDPA